MFNEEVDLDVVCFIGKPFLRTECKTTKLSSIIQLPNREATTLWNSFVYSWIFSTAHSPPGLLQADPEFNNGVFSERTKQWGIIFKITAAKAKWQQGIVERGNGVLRAIFNRIDKDRPGMPLYMKVAQAAFSKNIIFGSRKASSFELVHHRPFPVDGSTTVLPKELHEAYKRAIARRKIGTALGSRTRRFPIFKKNEYIYFYREHLGGFIGPAKVIQMDKSRNMEVLFSGKVYSVSCDMAKKTQQPLDYWIEDQLPEEEQSKQQSNEQKAESNALTLKLKNYRPGDPRPESVIQNQSNAAKQTSISALTSHQVHGPCGPDHGPKEGARKKLMPRSALQPAPGREQQTKPNFVIYHLPPTSKSSMQMMEWPPERKFKTLSAKNTTAGKNKGFLN